MANPAQCPECKGSGYIPLPPAFPRFHPASAQCQSCHGTGNLPTECPWCGSKQAPVATDVEVANFVHSDPRDPKARARNPLMCPECHGVGGFEDWGL